MDKYFRISIKITHKYPPAALQPTPNSPMALSRITHSTPNHHFPSLLAAFRSRSTNRSCHAQQRCSCSRSSSSIAPENSSDRKPHSGCNCNDTHGTATVSHFDWDCLSVPQPTLVCGKSTNEPRLFASSQFLLSYKSIICYLN
jgi:hypothetical protein